MSTATPQTITRALSMIIIVISKPSKVMSRRQGRSRIKKNINAVCYMLRTSTLQIAQVLKQASRTPSLAFHLLQTSCPSIIAARCVVRSTVTVLTGIQATVPTPSWLSDVCCSDFDFVSWGCINHSLTDGSANATTGTTSTTTPDSQRRCSSTPFGQYSKFNSTGIAQH